MAQLRAEGECRARAMQERGQVCRLMSPEIVGIMKNSAGTSKQAAGHFL